MSGPSNTREALIAELLGDMSAVLDRSTAVLQGIKEAEASTLVTTEALREATQNYRSQVDEQVTRLRAETSNMIAKATDAAAQAVVGQQTAVLERAANVAIQKAFQGEVMKKARMRWMLDVGCLLVGIFGLLALIWAIFFFKK